MSTNIVRGIGHVGIIAFVGVSLSGYALYGLTALKITSFVIPKFAVSSSLLTTTALVHAGFAFTFFSMDALDRLLKNTSLKPVTTMALAGGGVAILAKMISHYVISSWVTTPLQLLSFGLIGGTTLLACGNDLRLAAQGKYQEMMFYNLLKKEIDLFTQRTPTSL